MSQPTLTDGTTTVTLNITTDVSETEELNIVIHNIPGRSGSILQFMGRESKTIPLEGYTNSQSEKNTLKNWARAGTSLTYNDDENTTMDVRIVSFSNTRKSSNSGSYWYNMSIIEDE